MQTWEKQCETESVYSIWNWNFSCQTMRDCSKAVQGNPLYCLPSVMESSLLTQIWFFSPSETVGKLTSGPLVSPPDQYTQTWTGQASPHTHSCWGKANSWFFWYGEVYVNLSTFIKDDVEKYITGLWDFHHKHFMNTIRLKVLRGMAFAIHICKENSLCSKR